RSFLRCCAAARTSRRSSPCSPVATLIVRRPRVSLVSSCPLGAFPVNSLHTCSSHSTTILSSASPQCTPQLPERPASERACCGVGKLGEQFCHHPRIRVRQNVVALLGS